MKGLRFTFVRIIAVILVIGLAVFSPLLSLPAKDKVAYDMSAPPQPRHMATFDRPRPEFRIERVLRLDEFKGFDPDLAWLLEATGDPQKSEISRARDTGVKRFDEMASISHRARGGDAR